MTFLEQFNQKIKQDQSQYVYFLKEQSKFFKKIYVQFAMRKPDICKTITEILKNLQREIEENAGHNKSGNTNKQPIRWHRNGIEVKG